MNKEDVRLSIVFNPKGSGTRFFSHPSYSLAHDPVRNVIHNALERKADQIKRAGTIEPGRLAGVFLCDGDCAILRAQAGVGVVSANEIIRTFLRHNNTVDFVCVLDVIQGWGAAASTPRFEARTWSLRAPDWAERFSLQFNTAVSQLPPPIATAVNTLNHRRWAGKKQHLFGHYAGSSMGDTFIEISLRAVMDYVSGLTDRSQFELRVNPHWISQLRRRLEEGRSIESVTIERHPGRDDDGLVLRFGDHDAARSTFRPPSAGLCSSSAEDLE